MRAGSRFPSLFIIFPVSNQAFCHIVGTQKVSWKKNWMSKWILLWFKLTCTVFSHISNSLGIILFFWICHIGPFADFSLYISITDIAKNKIKNSFEEEKIRLYRLAKKSLKKCPHLSVVVLLIKIFVCQYRHHYLK